jgi:hypothetical protein
MDLITKVPRTAEHFHARTGEKGKGKQRGWIGQSI